jgi:hypothetical protein
VNEVAAAAIMDGEPSKRSLARLERKLDKLEMQLLVNRVQMWNSLHDMRNGNVETQREMDEAIALGNPVLTKATEMLRAKMQQAYEGSERMYDNTVALTARVAEIRKHLADRDTPENRALRAKQLRRALRLLGG